MRTRHFFLLSLVLLAFMACKPKSEADNAAAANTDTSDKNRTFKVDVARSEIRWEASKPLGSHHGIVPILDGTVVMDGDKILDGKVVIDMKNLQAQEMDADSKKNLEEHLKGNMAGKEDDFFNVSKYPTATYTITSADVITGDPEATHMINGQLTMRDITKPVSFKAKVDLAAKDAVKITSLPFAIDRTEWGIKFKSKKLFDNLKDDFVNDEVKLSFTLGAIR